MSTRSYVLVEQADGSIKGVYVHCDGDKHLETLNKYYSTKRKRDALLKLGDLSILAEKTGRPPKGLEHEVGGKSAPGYCLAYHRDRGDEFTNLEFSSWKDFIKQSGRFWDIQFVYLWDKNNDLVKKNEQVGWQRYLRSSTSSVHRGVYINNTSATDAWWQ